MSEIKSNIEDVGDKIKAAAKAASTTAKDPDRDLETEYQKEKMKEKILDKPLENTTSASTAFKLSSSSIPQYKKILVPHDHSDLSDRALSHAIYLSNTTGAEIIILNIVKDIEEIEHTTMSATTKEVVGNEKEVIVRKDTVTNESGKKRDTLITMEGEAERVMEEKVRLCKEAGAKNQVSYKMQTGKKTVEEILDWSENMNIDLIVMASSKITSPLKGLASTTRKVIDGSKNPVLVIHEE
jgi:nucleotide-binding universal stress UspA family protein